ncbi:Nuclear intron maturase 1 [Ranunculus cassubicifolius]
MSLRHFIKHLPSNPSSILKPFSTLTPQPPLRHLHPPPQPPHKLPSDPHSLMHQDPIQIISDLWYKTYSNSTTNPIPNLTGFLKKFDLWVLAYQRSCAEVTGSFPPHNAIHLNVLKDLVTLQSVVLHGNYVWGMKTEGILRSPNEKPLKLMSKRKVQELLKSDKVVFQDCVVQEVLLMVLEPVFEPRFSKKSHGFRPGRNAHTFIREIRSNFAGYLWFLKGDMSEIFDRVDKDMVMGCVEKGVKDRNVLRLVKSALRTPVRNKVKEKSEEPRRKKKIKKNKGTRKKFLNENEPKPDPYWLRTFFSFAPMEAETVPSYGHCGILSPLLANVCLTELDNWMEENVAKYFSPSKLDSIWKDSITDGCHNPAWPEFVPSSGREKTRKMDYLRYGGHFLIGIRGPREDAVEIRKKLIAYCENTYGIKLDNEKVEIEHISRGIQFLDHIICRRVIYPTLRYTASGGKIVSEKGVGTLLSVTASLQQCIRLFRRLRFVKGDKDPEPLPCTPMLYASQAHTNSQMNKFLETMADWYKYADNRKKIVGFCAYVIRSSLAKLYAARYRLKSRAKVYKIATRDLSRPLREHSNTAAPEYSDLLRMGLIDAIDGVQFSRMSAIPSCDYTPLARDWAPDHERVLHEYVRLQDPRFFCELLKSVKQKGLTFPQEEISKMVWDYKTGGIWSRLNRNDREIKQIESSSPSEGDSRSSIVELAN